MPNFAEKNNQLTVIMEELTPIIPAIFIGQGLQVLASIHAPKLNNFVRCLSQSDAVLGIVSAFVRYLFDDSSKIF